MSTTTIYGPPGTGKTTELLRLVKDAIQRGANPNRIAFVSFTKAAVEEAVKRTGTRAPKYFRTLHSLAYAMCGASKDDVLNDYNEFNSLYPMYPISTFLDEDSIREGGRQRGDLLLHADNLARATGRPHSEIIMKHGLQRHFVTEHACLRFSEALNEYKKKRGLIDFADMIRLATGKPLDLDAVFIDEAQDLTHAQWVFCDAAFARVPELTVAGDDDQAIYAWAGADVTGLQRQRQKTRVLGHSFRLGAAVHDFAQRIAERIDGRTQKDFTPAEHECRVVRNIEHSNLPLDSGSWLLLARHTFALSEFVRVCRAKGLRYVLNGQSGISEKKERLFRTHCAFNSGQQVRFEDLRELATAVGATIQSVHPSRMPVRKTDVRLPFELDARTRMSEGDWRYLTRIESGEPRIRISTIHRAKGDEADNVALSPDVSEAVADSLSSHGARAADEHRVFYVGVTRAKKALFLVNPTADLAYPWISR